MLPDKNTIREIFSIVKALNDTERKARKEYSKNSRFRGQTMLMWVPSFSVIAEGILCIVSNLFKIQLLFQVSLVFLDISYLALLISETILTFQNIWTSRIIFLDPVGSLLDNSIRLTELDPRTSMVSINMNLRHSNMCLPS